MATIEKDVENYFVTEIKKLNGLCFKFTSPGHRGVPDRIVIYKGKTYFVELKRPGEKLRANQEFMHRQIKRRGVNTYVLDSKREVARWVEFLQNEKLD